MKILTFIIELLGKILSAKKVEPKEIFPEFAVIDSSQTLKWHESRT